MQNKEVLELFLTNLQSINRFLRSKVFDRQDLKITRVQWLLLRHLSCTESRSIGQLADHLNVRPSTMSQMLDRLEKAELISRTSSKEDARSKAVRLTPQGASLIRETENMWLEAMSGPFGKLTDHEKQMLIGVMEKLVANLNLPDKEKET